MLNFLYKIVNLTFKIRIANDILLNSLLNAIIKLLIRVYSFNTFWKEVIIIFEDINSVLVSFIANYNRNCIIIKIRIPLAKAAGRV